MRNRFYFDEIYGVIINLTQEMLARLAVVVDRYILSGFMVRGLHGGVELAGRALRLAQTGNLQSYAFILAAGVAIVLLLLFRP